MFIQDAPKKSVLYNNNLEKILKDKPKGLSSQRKLDFESVEREPEKGMKTGKQQNEQLGEIFSRLKTPVKTPVKTPARQYHQTPISQAMEMYNWIYSYMQSQEEKKDKFTLQVNIV